MSAGGVEGGGSTINTAEDKQTRGKERCNIGETDNSQV